MSSILQAYLDDVISSTYSPFDMENSDRTTTAPPLKIVEGVDFITAPLLSRIIAYVIDIAASVIILLSLHRFIGTWILNVLGNDSFTGMTINTSLWFIGSLGYWVVVPAVTGATPAKMLFQLRILSESPGPLTLLQVIQREIIGHAASILSLGMGFLYLASRDPKGHALNDRLSGTRLIQFSSPHPELYQVQDLHADTSEGIWISYEAEGVEDLAERPPESAMDPGSSTTDDTGGGESVQSEYSGQDSGVIDSTQSPHTVKSIPPPATGSFYARPSAETAFERKQRAARGPTVQELAEALRRTAVLVEQGQLMQKVLDKKRHDFVAQMERIDLSEAPTETIRIVVEMGREGLLSRDELETVRDILQNRLAD
ncbi:RDD family protein [Candidatus Zixiibacteriota bacterium]